MPDDPGFGWQAASWVWERKDEIGQKLADLYRWFRGTGRPDERGILILGSGGTGKTTLARILSGRFDWLTDDPWRYDESIDIEHYALADDPRTEVVVPPGQSHRRESTWPKLLAAVGEGRYRGIILLTAYGHHSLAVPSYKGHELYAGNKDDFVREYLAGRRADEMATVQHIAQHLPSPSGKMWLLTVVAKQDLWWKERAEVEAYHNSGPYAAEVRSLQVRLGAARFRSEVAFASLLINNLDTREGERIKANEAGYDHRQQVTSLRRLLEIIAALKDWEERP